MAPGEYLYSIARLSFAEFQGSVPWVSASVKMITEPARVLQCLPSSECRRDGLSESHRREFHGENRRRVVVLAGHARSHSVAWASSASPLCLRVPGRPVVCPIRPIVSGLRCGAG